MPGAERNSERAQLISPNDETKPSFMNLISNISAFVFILIITYCCFKNGISLFSFHPILMSVGWLILMTSAINAITPGDLATEWMPIRLRSARHWVIQVFAIIIILVGFLVILSNKIINGKDHFVTLHGKFGLASFIFMIITSFGGLGALYSLKLKHYIAPLYTKILHSSIGLLTFSLGIITITLGCFSNWWNASGNGDVLRYISLVLVLITMILTILRPSLKVYFRIKERLGCSN
ncbi:transmembrane reductase CYB561D2-like [Aricia agestis]|uniref:transmembrane reductase CYB561D2-like n=1 Tax=Aricia agestis TaxID=91739 RepID=UPI001C201A55|nr:transmembrane reductase CYB561D2-like [Aricia agestis]XP_041973353.1 transmembrane reductase CYB561D2-like [Aricia agestis]